MDPNIIQKIKTKLLSGENISDEYLYNLDVEIQLLKKNLNHPQLVKKKLPPKKNIFIKLLSFHRIFCGPCSKYNASPLFDYHK